MTPTEHNISPPIVLHLIDSAGMYGAEHVIVSLMQELSRKTVVSILGCIQEPGSHRPELGRVVESLGLPVEYFPMRRGISVSGVRSIVDYVRERKIAIVHSHGYKPNILMSLTGKRSFKLVSTVHGWSKESAGLKGRLYELADAFVLRRMDCVVAVSQAVEADLASKGVSGERVHRIYNGIVLPPNHCDSLRQSVRMDWGVPEGEIILGTLGRLSPVKGHGYLIKAMQEVVSQEKNLRLIIAGDGFLKSEYERLIADLGLGERVSLHGYTDDVDGFLSAIDIFVLPSLSEGLPMAILEAMAKGKPIIASRVGGIPEAIRHLSNGILVSPADPKSLAKEVLHLCRNSELAHSLGVEAQKVVATQFTAKSMADHYLALYEQTLMANAN